MDRLELSDFAEANDILLLYLSSHGTKWLQPLDKTVYIPLKYAWGDEYNTFEHRFPGRKIKGLQFGDLLARAWQCAATISNALSGFRSTGIYSFDPASVPDYAYLTCNPLNVVLSNAGECSTSTSSSTTITSPSINVPAISTSSLTNLSVADIKEPTSGSSQTNEETPTKVLLKISRVPVLEKNEAGREKQHAFLINREAMDHKREKKEQIIADRKQKAVVKRPTKNEKKMVTKSKKEFPKQKKIVNKRASRKVSKKLYSDPSNSSDDTDLNIANLCKDSSSNEEEFEEVCIICGKFGKSNVWYQCTHVVNGFIKHAVG